MYSINNRVSTVINQALTFGILVVAIIVSTSWYQLYTANAFNSVSLIDNIKPSFAVRTSRYFGSTNNKPKQNAKITFDLDVDLSSLFNWNTKQVFVYLTAEYNGTKRKSIKNTVTFWDKIILSRENSIISLSDEKGKYNVWDLEEKIQSRDMEFKLQWNIQPWVGPLLYGETVGSQFITLDKKVKKPVQEEEEKKIVQEQEEVNDVAEEAKAYAEASAEIHAEANAEPNVEVHADAEVVHNDAEAHTDAEVVNDDSNSVNEESESVDTHQDQE